MTVKTLALLSLCLLLTPAALADVAPPPRIWLVHTTVEATVQDAYAIVKVIADISNRGPDPEFPFQVRIPDDAFVTGLTIERDGKVFQATIEKRAEARQTYEEQKQAQQTGGLVEKARSSSVYAYLINVAEFTNVRATLTYERALAADRGVYSLPLEAPVSGFGRDTGADFTVTIRDADGVTGAWSEPSSDVAKTGASYVLTHRVGDRLADASTPFNVSFNLPATPGAGSLLTSEKNGTGYFVHRFRAPMDDRHMPVDLVMVLDVSGSMSGLKMKQMQDAATQVLQSLRPEDRLHLAFFSSDAASSWKGLRPMTLENRKQAAVEIAGALVAGGTNLDAAIRTGFGALDGVDWTAEEGRLPALVLLTDGQPTSGITDRTQLRDIATKANAHGVNVFAIAFGADADWAFLHAIAADANGLALRVPEGAGAEVDLRRFMETLAAPVLKDVKIAYDAGGVAYRPGAPILFAGSELLVVGTYDPKLGPLHAHVTARDANGSRSYDATGADTHGAVWLPRVVAYQEIRRYQDLIDAEGARDDWIANLTALALQHGFVTDQTSLVVKLEPRHAPTQPTPQRCCWTVDPAQGSSQSNATTTHTMVVYDQSRSNGGAASSPMYPLSTPAPGGPSTTTAQATSDPRASPTFGGPTPTPDAKVPGVGLLALVALGAMVALARRRT